MSTNCKKILFGLIGFLALGTCFSQDLSLYKKEWLIIQKDTLPYRILLPENYNPNKKYPLVLFLHGGGERGKDNQKQLVHGGKLFLKPENRKEYPAIVVFPQCPGGNYWSNVDTTVVNGKKVFDFKPDGDPTSSMKMLQMLLIRLLDGYGIDDSRVYVMGLSMGGMGTFEIVRRMPKFFAAAIAICGGADTATAADIKKVNWWIFHGEKDDIVSPDFSKNMVKALENEKANVKFTLFPTANHNAWDPAFAENGLLKWLFSQKK